MRTMYETICMLAKKKGVSVAQVERDCGFSAASLRKLQTANPSADKVLKLARYFDVSTDYLYGKSEIEKTADQLMDEDFVTLHRARQNMPPEEWKRAMDIIRVGFADAFGDE